MRKKLLRLFMAAMITFSAAPTRDAFAEDNAEGNEKYEITQNAEDIAETARLAADKPVKLCRMENLGRGVATVKTKNGIFVSWRLLGTDDASIKFNVYRDGSLLNSEPIESTNITDEFGTVKSKYEVVPVIDGLEKTDEKSEQLMSAEKYVSIKVEPREGYEINDASVGDLDGDGEYEFVVRRNPIDMELETRTAYPLIEAYRLNGEHMWTINIGPNEINTVDINFLVYDFDGDGKAEIATRSFEGTVDGEGTETGDVNGDGITNYEYSIVKFTDRQYLSEGPEFLSVYDGLTGKELARTDLLPSREPVVGWGGFPEGDGRNVKRSAHFLFAVAYLNGETPSIVLLRGAWNSVGLAAWNYNNGDISVLWEHKNETASELNNLYGAGFHSLAVADVDFDGKDEILSGALCVDDNGDTMYATSVNGVKLGHGDAFDVAVMSPDNPGYYAWACHETGNLPTNAELHDARTGEVIYGYSKPKDTGRSRSADIDPTHRGWEMWASTETPIHSFNGEVIAADETGNAPVSMNMKLYWDGDLLAELMDYSNYYEANGYGTPYISKWDWEKKTVKTLLEVTDCATIGGTKGQEPLVADIWGDWRDEVIMRDIDNTELRIYTTSIATDYRMPTLMHDRTYREAIAWQNNHYNQPANTSFYFGAETEKVPVPEIYTIKNGIKTINPVYEANPPEHAFISVKTNDPEKVVEIPEAVDIVISRAPDSVVNYAGAPLNTDGLEVTAYYDNGSNRILSQSEYTVSYTPQLGKQTVTVEYQGKKAEFEITVIESDIRAINRTYFTDSLDSVNLTLPIGTYGGSFIIEHTVKINSMPAECGSGNNDTNGFFMRFMNTAENKTGGGWYIARDGSKAKIVWKATGTTDIGTIDTGKPYVFRYEFSNVGTGEGAHAAMTILDESGKAIASASDLNIRNFTFNDAGKGKTINELQIYNRANSDSEASVTFGDAVAYGASGEITEINGKDISVNITGLTPQTRLIAAKYSGEALESIKIFDSLSIGAQTVTAEFEPDRAFLWNDMTPLCGAKAKGSE